MVLVPLLSSSSSKAPLWPVQAELSPGVACSSFSFLVFSGSWAGFGVSSLHSTEVLLLRLLLPGWRCVRPLNSSLTSWLEIPISVTAGGWPITRHLTARHGDFGWHRVMLRCSQERKSLLWNVPSLNKNNPIIYCACQDNKHPVTHLTHLTHLSLGPKHYNVTH